MWISDRNCPLILSIAFFSLLSLSIFYHISFASPSDDPLKQGYGPNRDVVISIQRYGDSVGIDQENCDGESERSRCLPSSNNQHLVLSDNTSHNPVADDSINPPPSYSQIPGTVALYSGRSSGPPPSYDEVVNPYSKLLLMTS